MILGLEDIPGGTPLFSFFVWLALSGLFYLVCYVAVLNVLDDITRNSLLKIPAMLMKEINQEDLVIGLKTATDELKEKLFSNMSERAALMMKEDLESLGPKKISEVQKSQQKVIDVCKKLEEAGKLAMGGGADEMV